MFQVTWLFFLAEVLPCNESDQGSSPAESPLLLHANPQGPAGAGMHKISYGFDLLVVIVFARVIMHFALSLHISRRFRVNSIETVGN